MDITRVLIKPLLTEKTYAMNSNKVKVYAFLVNLKASKYEIVNAFAALYEFKPLKVNVQIRKPSKTRTMSYFPGFTKRFKIAYITLPPGKDISVSNQEAESKQNDAKITAAQKAKEKGKLKEVKFAEDKKIETKKVEKPNK